MTTSRTILCHQCGRRTPQHESYIVRVDVFADPQMPPVDLQQMDQTDPGQHMRELIEQMKDMSQEELQDQVHRRFEYRICRACQMKLLTSLRSAEC